MITITLSNTQNSNFLTVEPLEDLTVPLSGLSDTLQHQQLSLTFKLAYDADVFDYIMAYEELNAVVYDNSTPVFTGKIKNEITWTDNGYPLPVDSISLVISDNTYLFEAKTQTEFALINQKLADIVDSVCQACGAELAENTTLRDVTVQAFVLDADKSYLEALNNLLFQYGYAFGFNGSGQVKIIDLATVPTQRVQLTETDFFAGLEIKRTKKNYTGIQLKYNELVKKENEQVYWEGNGVNEENKVTPIVLRPHQYYPYDSDPTQEQREGQVYQTFENGYAESYTLYSGEQRYRRSTKTTLVYTENHRVVNDWDDGIVINRTEFGARQASVRLYNSANQDKNLYQLAIRADAWYRSQDVIYNYGENKTPYEYQSEYIYESEAAENFCSLLSRFFMGGNFKVTAQLSVGLEMGLHVAIDTGLGGFVCNAIVTACDYDAKNQKYKCSFISYGEAAVIASRYKKYASNYGSFSESQVYTESELVKYRGLLTQLPENPKNGEFFLVKETFSVASRLRLVDNSLLKLINGNYLVIQKPFSASYIYIYQDNTWQRIDDKNDYHYILASNDLIAMGWKLSDNLQDTLDQIDENAQQYADTAENNATSAAQDYAETAEQNAKDYTDGEIEVVNNAVENLDLKKIEYVPRYKGKSATAPAGAKKDDWFLNTTSGTLQKFNGTTWENVDAYNPSNAFMYNEASKDCLEYAAATGNVASYAAAFIAHIYARYVTLDNPATPYDQFGITTDGFAIEESDDFDKNNVGQVYGFSLVHYLAQVTAGLKAIGSLVVSQVTSDEINTNRSFATQHVSQYKEYDSIGIPTVKSSAALVSDGIETFLSTPFGSRLWSLLTDAGNNGVRLLTNKRLIVQEADKSLSSRYVGVVSMIRPAYGDRGSVTAKRFSDGSFEITGHLQVPGTLEINIDDDFEFVPAIIDSVQVTPYNRAGSDLNYMCMPIDITTAGFTIVLRDLNTMAYRNGSCSFTVKGWWSPVIWT